MDDKTDSDFSTFMKLGGAAGKARDEYDAARQAINDAMKAHGVTPGMWDRLRNAAHAYNDADIAYRRYLHDNHVMDGLPAPVSDFDPDNTMDYIRYLMKKINKLEADVTRLNTACDANSRRMSELEHDVKQVKHSVDRVMDSVCPRTALEGTDPEAILGWERYEKKLREWWASGENGIPNDDDPWWNMP